MMDRRGGWKRRGKHKDEGRCSYLKLIQSHRGQFDASSTLQLCGFIFYSQRTGISMMQSDNHAKRKKKALHPMIGINSNFLLHDYLNVLRLCYDYDYLVY